MSTAYSQALWDEPASHPTQAVEMAVTPMRFPQIADAEYELPESLAMDPYVEQPTILTDAEPLLSTSLMEESIAEAARVAHQLGYEDGVSTERALCEVRVAEVRASMSAALSRFAEDRIEYFLASEAEIVRLALAIGERILHREIAEDPTVLSRVVRAALDRLSDQSGVTLRIPAHDLDAWATCVPSLPMDVQIQGDASMVTGNCVLETRMGTIELGIAAQLEEIERGLFELMGRRPAAA